MTNFKKFIYSFIQSLKSIKKINKCLNLDKFLLQIYILHMHMMHMHIYILKFKAISFCIFKKVIKFFNLLYFYCLRFLNKVLQYDLQNL